MEAYLKYAFAALALTGGVLLYLLGSGEGVQTAAAGLISGAVGLIAGRVGTVPVAKHREAGEQLEAERVKNRRITGELIEARSREAETRP